MRQTDMLSGQQFTRALGGSMVPHATVKTLLPSPVKRKMTVPKKSFRRKLNLFLKVYLVQVVVGKVEATGNISAGNI